MERRYKRPQVDDPVISKALQRIDDEFSNFMSWAREQFADIAHTHAGMATLYYDDTELDVAGYNGMLTEADTAAAEEEDSVVVAAADGEKLIDQYITEPGIPGTTIIPGGIWQFRTYARVSTDSAATFIRIRVYKRTVLGAETELFYCDTPEIDNLALERIVHTSAQDDFVVNDTDRLVFKVYAYTSRVPATTVYFSHNGTEHYSNVVTTFLPPGGASSGDMTKAVYDTNDDGVVDESDYAEDSGDADTVDGQHAAAFAALDHKTRHENGGADEISVAGLSGELADNQPPKAHAASHQSGGGDAVKLDDLSAPDDNTDLDVSTTKHGLCPKAPNDTARFLRGDATWDTPSGGADPWTVVKLTSDFQTASTSAVNVTGLKFTPAINKKYLVYGIFMLNTDTENYAPRVGATWPSSLVDGVIMFVGSTSAVAVYSLNYGDISAEWFHNLASLPNTTQSWPSKIEGILVTGAATSGDFQVRLRQENAAALATMKAGSFIAYREI